MFAARRQRVLDAMGPDSVALFVGARMVTRSNDTDFPFRQDSDFWYLTGFDHPEAVAVLRTDGGPPFTLYVQPREPEAETWTGYRPGVEGAVADFGANEAHPISSLRDHVARLVSGARRLYHVLGRDGDLDRRILEALEDLRRRSRTGALPPSEIVDPRSVVHEMRLRKSEQELAILREAQDITRQAHRAAALLAQPGRYEYELEAALNGVFRGRGGAGPAYTTIVGGGANATTLHYVRNDQVLGKDTVVLIDAGVEWKGYAADVTRTYPVGGRFDPATRDAYQAVLEAQEAAIAASRPGTTLDEIHRVCVRTLVGGMVELGLLRGVVDELVASEAYRPYYMHRTSHWLGLDVHDVGAYSLGGPPRPLEPGMVFTIEPGLYVPADDESAPPALRGVGIRIEDDVAVTPNGVENLSARIPKKPDEIEAWVAEG